MNWLQKTATARYLGQCDRLRQCGNEEKWQQMMQQKIPVSLENFIREVDINTILEPDESIEEFIARHDKPLKIKKDVPERFTQRNIWLLPQHDLELFKKSLKKFEENIKHSSSS